MTPPKPQLFALPPGVDFGAEVVRGIQARMAGQPPEATARIALYANTRRMQRHLRACWDSGPPALVPRLRLITDLGTDPLVGLPAPVPPLARRMELVQLIGALLDRDPDLAPRSALFDLASSLSALLDEMEIEGMAPGALDGLEPAELSAHWQTALTFLKIAQGFLADSDAPPGAGRRQRLRAEALAALWATNPPTEPVIVAGSTGSRGATASFLRAVAHLPQGAVILPGFDFDLPASVWDSMSDAMQAEDHPQYRFKKLLDSLGLRPGEVQRWTDAQPTRLERNRLISLALRPAPVTDAWLREGPGLGPLNTATEGLTLVEAAGPRAEAEVIALGLRQAAAEGRRAALITPDRMLTRQVAATLDRWGLRPDDSAGQPLALSPPGRFLRHALHLMTDRPGPADLLALLKHPLCQGPPNRGRHMLHSRALELDLRRRGPAHPDAAALRAWGARDKAPADRPAWAAWLADALDARGPDALRPVPDHLAAHLAFAEALAGPSLWDAAAGRKARSVVDGLARHGAAAGSMTLADYATLFDGVIGSEEVRDRDAGDPRMLIWGTLESRVQHADLVILGGLNDGTWPEPPPPDPWLNRQMRKALGLTLPERQIGLSAHDFQQAIGGTEVWLTRAKRSDEAETVPSRWLNRMTNLLEGLPDTGGPEALQQMRSRGAQWLRQAEALSRPAAPVPAAPRPAPRPPAAARPRQMSVTELQTLIRDPYAVYARRVLRLDALDPLVPGPDRPLRGVIVHSALERFVKDAIDPAHPEAKARLMEAVDLALQEACPWPAHRRLWAAHMRRVAGHFLAGEIGRRAIGTPQELEAKGVIEIADPPMTLVGKADRIDRLPDGRLAIYDYKTGTPSTPGQQKKFDLQLLLEAAMTARGAFAKIGPAETARAVFIGLGASPRDVAAPLEDLPPDEVWAQFLKLLRHWVDPATPYRARPYPFTERQPGDYDHLARLGEWDAATPFTPEDLT